MNETFADFGFEIEVIEGEQPTLAAIIAKYGDPDRSDEVEVVLGYGGNERPATLVFYYYGDVGLGSCPTTPSNSSSGSSAARGSGLRSAEFWAGIIVQVAKHVARPAGSLVPCSESIQPFAHDVYPMFLRRSSHGRRSTDGRSNNNGRLFATDLYQRCDCDGRERVSDELCVSRWDGGAGASAGVVERLVTLTVNGQQRRVDVLPQETLSTTLRYKLGLTGTKIGCDRSECGACTVLVDGCRTTRARC